MVHLPWLLLCAGTLALMDAGVQIKKPVSGIAMGLISEKNATNYAILSDILRRRSSGDMTPKVTGTKTELPLRSARARTAR